MTFSDNGYQIKKLKYIIFQPEYINVFELDNEYSSVAEGSVI